MNEPLMRQIDVTALRTALTAEGTPCHVVDVREVHEFASGHVPGAVNVPLTQVADRVHEVTEVPGEVYVVCEAGVRSGQVAAWLGQQGYDVVNVTGGTAAWRAAGFPVE